jgi:hypothetical protein
MTSPLTLLVLTLHGSSRLHMRTSTNTGRPCIKQKEGHWEMSAPSASRRVTSPGSLTPPPKTHFMNSAGTVAQSPAFSFFISVESAGVPLPRYRRRTPTRRTAPA